jgi:hypothetical protein
MVSPQQQADADLAEWQRLRNAGLTPEQRLDALMATFFQPPIELDVRYQDQLNAVMMEMAE